MRCVLVLVLIAYAGCENAAVPPAADPPARVAAPGAFSPAATGTITGRVVWTGPTPAVPPFTIPGNPLAAPILRKAQVRPNPNAPVIDDATRGLANGVVFLRGVDSRRARAWDLPPVRVDQREGRLHVLQGKVEASVGFVRRGAAVEMDAHDSCLHLLHADGAAYFTLAFPRPAQPLVRTLAEPGVVELSSAAGYWWMRAYLFVDDHPYYARTDRTGQFTLSSVPAGRYEVVAWLPYWHVTAHARDPETGLVTRVSFAAPRTQVRTVDVVVGTTSPIPFEFRD